VCFDTGYYAVFLYSGLSAAVQISSEVVIGVLIWLLGHQEWRTAYFSNVR